MGYYYNRIDKVFLTDGHFAYLLTGDNVPAELEIDLDGGMLFNELNIESRNTYRNVKYLHEVIRFIIAEGYSCKISNGKLIVGGSEDGRIGDGLNFYWEE